MIGKLSTTHIHRRITHNPSCILCWYLRKSTDINLARLLDHGKKDTSNTPPPRSDKHREGDSTARVLPVKSVRNARTNTGTARVKPMRSIQTRYSEAQQGDVIHPAFLSRTHESIAGERACVCRSTSDVRSNSQLNLDISQREPSTKSHPETVSNGEVQGV